MWNRWVLFICFGIIALSVVSCSYASNETDILNNTDNTVSINAPSDDLESDNQNNDIFDDGNSDISIYYGEDIFIKWDQPHCNCTVYIDNQFVDCIHFVDGKTISMHYYYEYLHNHYTFGDNDDYFEDFLNSIYPNVGLHNISIIFEFDTPQKYDFIMNQYKDESELYIRNVLLFQFNVNDSSEVKKRYSYNTTLNVLKKDKTVHIINISSFATYSFTNPLYYDVIVENNNDNSSYVFISNKTGILLSSSSIGDMKRSFTFDDERSRIKPGVYDLTIVNKYDNTFDTASFTLFNDLRSINNTYKIKDNDVFVNVELYCEFNTTLEFILFNIDERGNLLTYRVITKEILSDKNNHKFQLSFNDVDNGNYQIEIYEDGAHFDIIGNEFTINYTFVNETGFIEDVSDVNETDNVSDIVEKNVSNTYNGNNTDGDGTGGNGTGDNLNLKGNSTNSHSHKSNVHNDNFKEVISGFGDLASGVDSVSSENANSYELIEKSTSKSADNIFTNLGIIILLLIALIVGFLRFKREN